MSGKTYTVFRSTDFSNIEGSGLSLKDAAETLLNGDGYSFEIVEKDGVFELFVSDGSRNSPRGARNMKSCAAGGFVSHDINIVYQKIVCADWHGCEAMTDEDYAASLEDRDEE